MYETPQRGTNFGCYDVKKWHAAEAHFQVKIHNTPHGRTDFGSVDREKWRAAVAQSAFASQNAQNAT